MGGEELERDTNKKKRKNRKLLDSIFVLACFLR